MIILIHSSKTMRPAVSDGNCHQVPELAGQTKILARYLKTLKPEQIAKVMAISPTLADKTHNLINSWSDSPTKQRPALDSFLGDIYSGLQVLNWKEADRQYANQTLRILSGLYGILKPFDGIYPYRLEMGYRLPSEPFKNLYNYWGKSIAKCLPISGLIINLAAVEYSKTVTPYVDQKRIITPSFLTISPKTGQPTFVVVHAKIARGAFASWLITERINEAQELTRFNELGYKYNAKLSTPEMPVYVCKTFGGIGLSVRLK